ncbi:acyltransferase family protein [Pantoea agglomerans]|uniref:acyltransferase family protein n=1 Tax=Enterobacter agglomerans TaxID=549 RepID=UPI003CEAD7DC
MEKLRPNSDIEILRAFAIIMVLVQHFPSLYFWSDHSYFAKVNTFISFWSGVDLFLCISGFVVSCSLIPLIDKCKDSGMSSSKTIAAFFTKRAFRLFPTSFLWIAIILALTFFYNISGAFGNVKWNIYQALSILTYNYNYLAAYMTDHGIPTTFGPFWSLNLEEQFYFIFPFFVLLTKKENRIPILIGLIAVQFFILRQGHPILNFRLDALSWGVVLAIMYMKSGMVNVDPTFLQNRKRSLLVTSFLIIFLMVSIPDMHESRFMVGFLGLASASLVFIASFNKGYIFCPKAVRKVLLWVGSRSYAIYIIHMPVIYFIQESTVRYYVSIGQGPSKTILLCAVMTLLALMMTVILVEMNFRMIEKPLRNYGRKLANNIKSRP